ncbi:MAG: radical SAM protein [Candidatus Omnitrophica bacterium]|nr:radical SAM protein [Candidatus Omnitrophota bacterium]
MKKISDKFRMNDHKLTWHLDRVQEWEKGDRIAPIYLEVGITRFCNIACRFCEYGTHMKTDRQMIETDVLIKFLREAASIGVKGIGFFGDGEPLIHPGIYEAAIEAKKAGIDLGVASNGLALVKDDKLKDFLDSLVLIRFNLSAARPESYASVTGMEGKHFNKVKENIRKCVEVKKKHNLNITIGVLMVLIKENENDIEEFAKLGKELGVDYVQIKQCTYDSKDKPDYIVDDYQTLEESMQKAESYATQDYGVIVKRKKMNIKSKKYDHCYGCNFIIQISGTGDVYPCSDLFENKKYVLGNINEQSFEDIVFGDQHKKVMDMLANDIDVHKECILTCRQNEINGFLWDLKNPPGHINFI